MNDIQDGVFTLADYKAAFARLDQLADRADNPRLKSTLILQSYSTRADSGRRWRNFVANPTHVDVLAWDVYNKPTPDAGYQVPPDLLDALVHASTSIGKPSAVADLGRPLAPGDAGSPRAEWLRRMGLYLEQHHAVFVCYLDFLWADGTDYRLRDARRYKPGKTSARPIRHQRWQRSRDCQRERRAPRTCPPSGLSHRQPYGTGGRSNRCSCHLLGR